MNKHCDDYERMKTPMEDWYNLAYVNIVNTVYRGDFGYVIDNSTLCTLYITAKYTYFS